MSRVARIVVPGWPHHITQRGNRRADVFITEDDRRTYLRWTAQYAQRHGLSIWAYCLMTNHVHLIVVPAVETSLARTLRDAHTVYAMYFNSRTGQSGHLWQGRFYSTPLDDAHLWAAVRYVERNPVRAGITDRAEDYPWSSAAAHCGLRADPLLAPDFPPPGVIEDWPVWLRHEEDSETLDRIRSHTRTGRPCGSEDFIDKLERALGRTLRPAKPGPKPKPRSAPGQGELF